MPKINTIATVPVPKLSDKLVGTSVGGTPVNQTNNFTLQQLKTLFDGTPVSPNLQAVLNAGNTAIQNIYLTGTIAATNATIANDASSKNLYLSERLFDRNNFQGTNGQYLISTGTGVQWSTLTIATPTLQQVLTAGNISDKDIITTGNIQGANIQGTNVTVNSNLRVIGAIADSTNSFGTSGQVLSSTVTGTDWVDLPSYSAVSPLIYNNISRQFSIQQATGTQNGYLSSADWITFNGKQNAGNYITELTGEASALGPGAVNITLNNLAVINKTLTGLAISSGVITAADSIITAFGKIQGQINGIVAGVVYKGAWNAATNTPTLTSSVGVQGNYYVVDVAGNTNLNGITDWQVGDWAIYNGSVWQKVDNTDAVTSVNGQTGIVVLNTDNISEGTTNLYYLNSRARAAISSVATGLTYTSSTGVFSLTSGYSIPTIANQTNWTTAYNDSIVSAAVTGTTTKTLTLTQQDGGTITASWTDIDTNLVTSVFGRTGAVVAQAGDYSTTLVTEGTNLYYLDSRARNAISSSATGLTYTTATGIFSFTAGYSIPTDASQSNWTTAYNDSITSAAVTGTTTKTLTLNQQDGGTITASWTDLDTGLTSVGVSMPSAFNVTNSPLTSNGTIAVTGAGTAAQYVRGDGTLGDFPTGGGGGGASVSYYLNGSINQGSFGGNTYYQMSKTPILGAGTDFSTSTNGYITQFITDVGTPDALLIPGGNWNFETYFSASSGGGTPTFYIELYKYDGATFTLIASNSSNPELIAFGTTINPYYNSLAVPETVLTTNDRLAIRIYVFTSGRTITLHTEDNHLCQAITTFTTGLTALNGLTKQIQYFAVGTSGTDFNISSSVATHTFNLPTASAVNRGALSSSDWSTFNSKQNALTLTTTGTSGAATLIGATLNIPQYQAAGTYVNSVTASSPLASSGGVNPNITIQQATATQNGFLSSTDWSTFNSKQNAITLTTTGTSGAATLVGSTLNIPQYQSVLTNPITGTGTTNFLPKFTGSTTVGNSQIFDNGTNVGIGTSSPTFRLDVQNNTQAIARVLDTSTNASLIMQAGSGSSMKVTAYNYASSTALPLYIQVDGANTIMQAGGGNLLVGTTTDNGNRLNVNGTGQFNGNSGGGYVGLIIANGSTGAAQMAFNNTAQSWLVNTRTDNHFSIFNATSSTTPFLITTSGNVGIGTINPAQRLSVAGEIAKYCTASGVDGNFENLIKYGFSSNLQSGTAEANRWIGIDATVTAGSAVTNTLRIRAYPGGFGNAAPVNVVDFRGDQSSFFYGNVGIGTSSPTNGLLVINSTAATGVRFALESSGTMNGIVALGSNAISGLATTDLALWTRGVMAFETGASGEKMRITSGGNLLVGTTTDNGARLQVSGTSTFTGIGTFNNGTNSTNGIKIISTLTSSLFTGGLEFIRTTVNGGSKIEPLRDAAIGGVGLCFQVTANNTAEVNATYTSAMTILNNGNVGIGTSNPATLLQVEGSAPIFTMNRTSGGFINRINFSSGGTNYASIISDAGAGEQRYSMGPSAGWGGYHTFYTDTTERMRITSGGNVGIGTSSPSVALEVSGASNLASRIRAVKTGSGTIEIGADRDTFGSPYISAITNSNLDFFTNDTHRLRITSGGNVLIGNTSAYTSRLTVQAAAGNRPAIKAGFGVVAGNGYWVLGDNYTLDESLTSYGIDYSSGDLVLGSIVAPSTTTSGAFISTQAQFGNLGSAIRAGNSGDIYFFRGTSTSVVSIGGAKSMTESMRLNSSGNLLIGTNSDNGARLQVNGHATFSSYILSSSFLGTTDRLYIPGNRPVSDWFSSSLSAGYSQVNTYGWVNGAGNLVLGTDGAERMRITSSGNVGIGTSSPTYRLQIGNSGGLANSIRIGDYQVSPNTRQYIGYARFDSGIFESSGNGDTPSTVLPGVAGIRIVNTAGIVTPSQADNSVQILTHIYNGNSRIVLHANFDGNVGIGTTTPNNARLHVDGGKGLVRTTDSGWGQFAVANPNDAEVGIVWAAGGTGYPGVTSTYTRQWIAGLSPFGTGTDRWSLTNSLLGANTAITVRDIGSVGIGTTNPSTRLSLGTGIGPKFMVYDNASNVYAGMGQDLAAGNSTDIFAHGAGGGFITFGNLGTNKTTYTEWMRINSSGNVLMGTTTDNGNRLRVNGVGFFDSGIRTGQPVGTTTNNWLLGRALISGTSTPNRWIRVQIGLEYYDILAVYMGTL